jgi:hypothetical protein
MIKLTAACCGCTVRTTRKRLDEGYPLCPPGQPIRELRASPEPFNALGPAGGAFNVRFICRGRIIAAGERDRPFRCTFP